MALSPQHFGVFMAVSPQHFCVFMALSPQHFGVFMILSPLNSESLNAVKVKLNAANNLPDSHTISLCTKNCLRKWSVVFIDLLPHITPSGYNVVPTTDVPRKSMSFTF
jgi:hypothetical protein